MAKKSTRESVVARRASAFQRRATQSRPVRKVVTRRTKRVIGWFSSVKMDCLVPWESQLEFDYLRLLEVDNSVIGFGAQPERLGYAQDGEVRRYVPDVRVDRTKGWPEIVEVKFAADAAKPENQERFELVADAYARRRLHFRVMTELDIRQQPRLRNAKLLLDHRDYAPSRALRLQVAEAFLAKRIFTLGDLEAAVGEGLRTRISLFGMALRGYFEIDLESAPLSADSLITSTFKFRA